VAASDPAHASRNAAIAAYSRWSREDPALNARRGQAGLVARFEREAREADPGASDAEIARRGMAGYRAHMLRVANASVAARKARASGAA
jgi:hypothetical protein